MFEAILKSTAASLPVAFAVGPQETLAILLVIVVLFGVKRLPQMAKSLGEGIREFRIAGRQLTADIDETKSDLEDAADAVAGATGARRKQRT